MTLRLRIAATLPIIALPAVASAQQLGGSASPDISLVRVFLALLVSLILAVLAILFIRQRMSGRMPGFLPRLSSGNTRIRLVESRRISPQAEISLVECDSTEYLLAIGPGGTLLLAERATNDLARKTH